MYLVVYRLPNESLQTREDYAALRLLLLAQKRLEDYVTCLEKYADM